MHIYAWAPMQGPPPTQPWLPLSQPAGGATTLKHQDRSPGTVALQPPHACTEAITTTCRDRFCHWHSLHSTAEITRGHQPRRHSPTWPLKLQQLGTTVVYCDSPPSYNNQVQARSHA